MYTVVCVAGARPNFMKIKPIVDALTKRGARAVLVHTGQHYDEAMDAVFFRDLGLPDPDHRLAVGSGSHAEQTARVMTSFEPLLAGLVADAVVVVGDVNATVGCALVAAKAGVVVTHVEAGLRSRDWSMPEEINRVVVDRVSDLLFAPSTEAVGNLHAEGYRPDQVHLVGNVMIDTLLANLGRAQASDALARFGVSPDGFALATLHRPANVDPPEILSGLLAALGEVARLIPVLWPVHPRTAARLGDRPVPDRVRLVPPAGYLDFIALQAAARLVLTDSGGVQAETTALGVPCLTLRENTEWPTTLAAGTNILVGRDRQTIVAAARQVLAGRPSAARIVPQAAVRAGERIVDVLLAHLDRPDRPHPTDRPATGQLAGVR